MSLFESLIYLFGKKRFCNNDFSENVCLKKKENFEVTRKIVVLENIWLKMSLEENDNLKNESQTRVIYIYTHTSDISFHFDIYIVKFYYMHYCIQHNDLIY